MCVDGLVLPNAAVIVALLALARGKRATTP